MRRHTGFEVSYQRADAQTMRDRRRGQITKEFVCICGSFCLSGLDPTRKAALSAPVVISVLKDTLTFVFEQRGCGQKRSFLSSPRIGEHTYLNTGVHTQLSLILIQRQISTEIYK